MSAPACPDTHRPVTALAAYERELAVVLDTVLTGDLGTDGTTVERRVVESLGALVWLIAAHRVDRRGRCRVCRPAWWRHRSLCTIYRALILYMRPASTYTPEPATAGAWS